MVLQKVGWKNTNCNLMMKENSSLDCLDQQNLHLSYGQKYLKRLKTRPGPGPDKDFFFAFF